MATQISLSDRDFAMLKLLEMTPATAAQIRRASESFPGDSFRDERRVRERLQTLSHAGFTKTCSAALATGGAAHYYRLSPQGFRTIHPELQEPPPKQLATDIAPSRFNHAMATADIIVHVLVSAFHSRVRVDRFLGDGRLILEVGEYRQQPDCFFQLAFAGRSFNLLFEVDNATEPIDSKREQSIRTKILGYESYQDWVLNLWKNSGKQGARPSFRTVFLTTGAARTNHILWLAQSLARNKDRRLVYATSQDQFLGSTDSLAAPIFNDHFGQWRALLNPQPTSGFSPRPPVRLRPPVAPISIV